MMGLSEDFVDSILCCVQLYLNGEIDIDDENIRKVVDEDEYLLKDMVDVASRRYTIEEKKKFLCNGPGCQGDNVAKLACHILLPKVIAFNNQKLKENIKQILRLKRKINKLRKGEDYDKSGSDEDDDVDGEEEGEQSSNDEGNSDTDG